MKRIYVGTLLCIILSLGLLTGCDQGVARSLGGDMTFEEIGCSGGFELSMIVLLNRMADTINRAIEATDDSV